MPISRRLSKAVLVTEEGHADLLRLRRAMLHAARTDLRPGNQFEEGHVMALGDVVHMLVRVFLTEEGQLDQNTMDLLELDLL